VAASIPGEESEAAISQYIRQSIQKLTAIEVGGRAVNVKHGWQIAAAMGWAVQAL